MFVAYLIKHYDPYHELISCFAEDCWNHAVDCYNNLYESNRIFSGDIMELLELDYDSSEFIVIRKDIC